MPLEHFFRFKSIVDHQRLLDDSFPSDRWVAHCRGRTPREIDSSEEPGKWGAPHRHCLKRLEPPERDRNPRNNTTGEVCKPRWRLSGVDRRKDPINHDVPRGCVCLRVGVWMQRSVCVCGVDAGTGDFEN
jgi:hypothetical protein